MTKDEAIDRRGEIVDSLRRISNAANERDLTHAQALDVAKLIREFDELAPMANGKTFADTTRQKATDKLGLRPVNELEDQVNREARWSLPCPMSASSTPKPGALLTRDQRMANLARSVSGARPDELSFDKWLKGAVTGNWRGADGELAEMYNMASSGGSVGGFMVPELLSTQVIDLARNKARIFEAGALTLPMTAGIVHTGRISADPTASWKAENAAATATDMTLERVTLQAKTVVALVKCSMELVEDADGIGNVLANSLAGSLALALDSAALRGTGGVGPTGIRNQANVQVTELNANGVAATLTDLSQAATRVETANGAPNAIIWNPRTAGAFALQTDDDGVYSMAGNLPINVRDLKRFSTNQIPITLTVGGCSTCTEIYVGDFTQCVIGLRTAFNVEVGREGSDSTDHAFSQLQLWIRAYLRADVMLSQPTHFNVLTGVSN